MAVWRKVAMATGPVGMGIVGTVDTSMGTVSGVVS